MGEPKRFEDQDMGGWTSKKWRLGAARFDDVDLSGSEFSDGELRRARFTDVNLAGLEIDADNIEGLKFLRHDVRALVRAEAGRSDMS